MDIRRIFASCLGGQIEQPAPQASAGKNPANLDETYQPSNSTQNNSNLSVEDQKISHQKVKIDPKVLKDILDDVGYN